MPEKIFNWKTSLLFILLVVIGVIVGDLGLSTLRQRKLYKAKEPPDWVKGVWGVPKNKNGAYPKLKNPMMNGNSAGNQAGNQNSNQSVNQTADTTPAVTVQVSQTSGLDNTLATS